jgi:hypothetical protein
MQTYMSHHFARSTHDLQPHTLVNTGHQWTSRPATLVSRTLSFVGWVPKKTKRGLGILENGMRKGSEGASLGSNRHEYDSQSAGSHGTHSALGLALSPA